MREKVNVRAVSEGELAGGVANEAASERAGASEGRGWKVSVSAQVRGRVPVTKMVRVVLPVEIRVSNCFS